MQDCLFKTCYFLFIRIICGIVLFFFIQIILERNLQFIIPFALFFLIERIISFSILHQNLNFAKSDLVLILILAPFYLDEFYIIIRQNKYPRYLNDGIDPQQLLISASSTPIYILILVYTGLNFTTINVALASIILLFLIINYFVLNCIFLFNSSTEINFWVIVNTIKEFLYCYFSCVCTLVITCINFNIKHFGLYQMILFSLLAIILLKLCYKRLKNISSSPIQIIFFCIALPFSLFLNIQIDVRSIADEVELIFVGLNGNIYGKLVLDKMLQFQFIQFLYLYITYSINLHINNSSILDSPTYQLIIFGISSILIIYQGYKLIKFIIIPALFGTTFLEYDSIEELRDNSEQDQSFNKNLQQVCIYQFCSISSQVPQILIETLFYSFQKSEIKILPYSFLSRSNIKNTKQFQQIQIKSTVQAESIISALNKGPILPQISEISLVLNENENIYKFYKSLGQFGVQHLVLTNLNNISITLLLAQMRLQITQTILAYLIYQKQIIFSQKMNPGQIFYDLYDNFND